MAIHYVTGDPLLTAADTLAFDHNARGRTEMNPLHTRLMRQYPTAFSAYTRLAKRGDQSPGDIFLWRDSTPRLLFLTLRDSSVGATRLRYVQNAMMTIARDYKLYNLRRLALTPLGSDYERGEIQQICHRYLADIALPVVMYTAYEPDIQADESFDSL